MPLGDEVCPPTPSPKLARGPALCWRLQCRRESTRLSWSDLRELRDTRGQGSRFVILDFQHFDEATNREHVLFVLASLITCHFNFISQNPLLSLVVSSVRRAVAIWNKLEMVPAAAKTVSPLHGSLNRRSLG